MYNSFCTKVSRKKMAQGVNFFQNFWVQFSDVRKFYFGTGVGGEKFWMPCIPPPINEGPVVLLLFYILHKPLKDILNFKMITNLKKCFFKHALKEKVYFLKDFMTFVKNNLVFYV